MSDLIWKYVKPLHDTQRVTDFLRKYSISLPGSLIECITKNNGGRPSTKLFDTDRGKEYVFKSLLSYNEDDAENIYKVFPGIFEGTSLYPIGSDVAGNFVCYDIKQGIFILLNHETNAHETIKRINE